MTGFTLGTAAKRLGLSKPTVSKFIKRGDIAAVKRDDGSYAIAGAELARFEASYRRQPVAEGPAPEPGPSGGQDLAVLRAELAAARERIGDMIARAERAEEAAEIARTEAAEARAAERAAWSRVAGLLEGPRVEPKGWWARLMGR